MRSFAIQILPIVGLALLLFACGNSDPSVENYEYSQPTQISDGWAVGHIEDVNIDEALLTSMMDAIADETYTGIDSVQIVRDNVLVFDELIRTELGGHDTFVGNTDLRVHSMQSTSKSFASALVGIAIDKGYIESVNQPFYSFFDEYTSFNNWSENKAAMTLQNVLTMRHGWQWDEWSAPYTSNNNSLGFTYRNSSDHVKYLLDLPMAATPGSTYAYSTIASVALGAAVENSSAMQLEDFADLYLFDPLGITSHIWAFTPVGRAHTGGGLWLGGRDMLKFGQLYLNRGVWNGEQIISSEWIDESLERRVNFDFGYSDGYGYQWWREAIFVAGQGSLEIYFTAGNGGQFIYLVPSKNTVIAFTGANYDDPLMYQADVLMRKFVLPALL